MSDSTFKKILDYYHIKLKRQGREFGAVCPFHDDKDPSLSINLEKEVFYCFGCGASGSGIDFVMQKEDISFSHAKRWITSKFGPSVLSLSQLEYKYRELSKQDIPTREEVEEEVFQPFRVLYLEARVVLIGRRRWKFLKKWSTNRERYKDYFKLVNGKAQDFILFEQMLDYIVGELDLEYRSCRTRPQVEKLLNRADKLYNKLRSFVYQ